MHRPLLGDVLHHLDLHRFDLFLGDHLADLVGDLTDLLLGHHLHHLHRHPVLDPLHHLANGLHGHLPNGRLGDHLHGLHGHLLHHLLIDVTDGLHRHLLGDDAVDVGRLGHLHRRVGRLVAAVHLIDDAARRHHPLIAAALPHGEAGDGIDHPAAGRVSEAGRARGHHRRDHVDRLAAHRVGGPHLGDRFGDGVGLLPLAGLIDGLPHGGDLLLHDGLVDRLHDGVLLVAGGRLDHVTGYVVAAVLDDCLVDRLHDGGPLFAGLRLPDRPLHGVAALLRLGLPDGLLHRVGLGVVDGLVGDPLRADLSLVVDGLVVEPVGLRGHRHRGRGDAAAALGGREPHRGRRWREDKPGAGEGLKAAKECRTGRTDAGRNHGFSPGRPSETNPVYAGHKRFVEKKWVFFPDTIPPSRHGRCNRPSFRPRRACGLNLADAGNLRASPCRPTPSSRGGGGCGDQARQPRGLGIASRRCR